MDLLGLSGAAGIAAVSGASLALIMVVVAIAQKLAVRRDIRAMRQVKPSAVVTLESEVASERANFSEAVREYEEALATRVGKQAPVGGDGRLIAESDDPLPDLESAKEEARQRLLAAQGRLEQSRPNSKESADLDLWFGSGILRGWQLGPIGYETVVLRVDHLTREDLWSLWSMGRFRLGMALGAEKQKLAIFAFGAPTKSIGELLSRGFGGTEAAVRPGVALSRTWRRMRRKPIPRQSIKQILRAANHKGLVSSPTDKCRSSAVEAYEYELGTPIIAVSELPGSEAMLAIQTSGPSLLAGIWSGREPQAKLVSASPDQAWS